MYIIWVELCPLEYEAKDYTKAESHARQKKSRGQPRDGFFFTSVSSLPSFFAAAIDGVCFLSSILCCIAFSALFRSFRPARTNLPIDSSSAMIYIP